LFISSKYSQFLYFYKACSHLKEIRLARCLYVSDESVRAIAKGCPKLHTIYLNNCSSITDSCIVALARGEWVVVDVLSVILTVVLILWY
jgi:hypothetical protein